MSDTPDRPAAELLATWSLWLEVVVGAGIDPHEALLGFFHESTR